MKKLFSSDKIGLLEVNITNKCNFTCNYCMMEDHINMNKYHIPNRNNQKIVLNNIISNFSNLFDDLTLDLMGGEPLLELDYMLEVIELFEPYSKQIYINTNGEILGNDDVLNKLSKYYDKLQFLIGFDVTQKSPFRLDKQLKNITKLKNDNKILSFLVISCIDDIQYIVEYGNKITEITGNIPEIFYNILSPDDLTKDIVILMEDKIKQVCSVQQYEKESNCQRKELYCSIDGTVHSCTEFMKATYKNGCDKKFDNPCGIKNCILEERLMW